MEVLAGHGPTGVAQVRTEHCLTEDVTVQGLSRGEVVPRWVRVIAQNPALWGHGRFVASVSFPRGRLQAKQKVAGL